MIVTFYHLILEEVTKEVTEEIRKSGIEVDPELVDLLITKEVHYRFQNFLKYNEVVDETKEMVDWD